MEREMKLLHLNEVWKLVKPPPDWKVIGNRLIFKRKMMLMEPWNDTRPEWLSKAAPRSLGSTMKRLLAQLFVPNPSGPL